MLGITVMKKLVTSLAAFTALTAAASAADLPRRAPPPVFTPVPVSTWTGAYFGINAGYGFDASSNSGRGFVQTPGNPVVVTPAGIAPYQALLPNGSSLAYSNDSREGFTGGGQIGYNWQLSPGNGAVIGFEADAQYLDFGRRARFATNAALINPTFVPINGTLNTIDFFGTVRGRLGYAFDRTLVYATGGFAYATGTDDGARVGFQNFAGRRNDFKTGWTVGGGIEYALPTDSFLNFFRSSAVTLKVEGLYVNLDNNGRAQLPLVGAAVTGAGLLPVYSLTNARRDENAFAVVRAGLNYKFGSY